MSRLTRTRTGRSSRLKSDQPDLCYDCHSRSLFLKRYQHKPAVTGKCTSCHNPHSSNNGRLLTMAMPDLCYKCHDKKMAAQAEHPFSDGGRAVHVLPRCAQLRRSSEAADHQHAGAVLPVPRQGQHRGPDRNAAPAGGHGQVHGLPRSRILRTPRTCSSPADAALCYKCHDKASFTDGIAHAPVEQGTCLSCHASHQSKTEKLLLAEAAGPVLQVPRQELLHRRETGAQARGRRTLHHLPQAAQRQVPLPADQIDAGPVLRLPYERGTGRQGEARPLQDRHVQQLPFVPSEPEREAAERARCPQLCYTCHNTEGFTGKFVHKPVAEGRCFDCHGNHTSPVQEPGKGRGERRVPQVPFRRVQRPPSQHTAARRHPDEGQRACRAAIPWTRWTIPGGPGRTMSCVSCHNPHSSDWKGLFRYKADKPADLCQHCHR